MRGKEKRGGSSPGRGVPQFVPPSSGSHNNASCRFLNCEARARLRGSDQLSFDLAGDKFLDAIARNVVSDLARRMFHRVGRDRIERAANFAVAGQL